MLPKNCQMLLFSATFEETVWNFAQRIVPDPNIIKLKREEETLDTIKQYYVLCNSREEKFQALCNIYGAITIAQAMIFCHVSSFTSDLYTWLISTLWTPQSSSGFERNLFFKKQITKITQFIIATNCKNKIYHWMFKLPWMNHVPQIEAYKSDISSRPGNKNSVKIDWSAGVVTQSREERLKMASW